MGGQRQSENENRTRTGILSDRVRRVCLSEVAGFVSSRTLQRAVATNSAGAGFRNVLKFMVI